MSKQPISSNEVVINQDFPNILNERMSIYSASVLSDRALPNIVDGCKPIHKRLLWTAHLMHLHSNKPHMKSMRIAAESLKFSAHGDSSSYGALVRLNQDFKLQYPLFDSQGAFGSSKEDPVGAGNAAARYTESRLSVYGEKMLEFIDKDTAPYTKNYDGTLDEPIYIPTLLPNIFQNNEGIAVGYASLWLPHNIAEVLDANIYRINNPTSTLKQVMKYLPGPDFPTGGIILNAVGITDAYKTGVGKIIVRGEIQKLAANKLVVKSLPFDVSIDHFLRQMDDIIETNTIGIKDFLDKSKKITKAGCYQVEIEITTNYGVDMDLIQQYLYKHTDLQVSFTFNQMAIVDNKPTLCHLLLTLDKIIQHQNNVLIKAYTFDLAKAKTRKEIVEGLLKATEKQSILDAIIKLIRSSKTKEEARTNLIKKYAFTELQVDAILALKLSQLVNTDIIALKTELAQLQSNIAEFTKIISNQDYRNTILIKKLQEYKKLFSLPRKTIIDTSQTGEINLKEEQTIVDEDKVLAITKFGNIKCVSKASFVKSDYDSTKLTFNDCVINQHLGNTKQKLVLLSSMGRAIPLNIHKIKDSMWKAIGQSINDFDGLQPNETIIQSFVCDATNKLTLGFVTKQGKVKRMLLQDISTITRQKWTLCMKLAPEDCVVSVFECPDKNQICFVTKQGQGLSFAAKNVSVQGKTAAGMIGIKVKNDEVVFGGTDFTHCLVGNKNEGKVLDTLPKGNRGTMGSRIINSKNTIAFGCLLAHQKDIHLECLNEDGSISWTHLQEWKVGNNAQVFKTIDKAKHISKIVCLPNLDVK